MTPADRIARLEYAYRGLCEIREIYCNMEGFIPETAAEGYVLQEIRKMYETATEFIRTLDKEALHWQPLPAPPLQSAQEKRE